MSTSLMKSKASATTADASVANARLVLATGSQVGREAPLQDGYYMIGRHRECQIRPKSRSVSRRHCLLYRDQTGLQVLDLDSTAGTRVNDRRLESKTWTRLRQGDTLRCGKVLFRIELGAVADAEGHLSAATEDLRHSPQSVPVGEAWHDLDVAGFLESQDDADRTRRYEDIRTANRSSSDVESSEDLQSTTEIDLDLFEDAFSEPDQQVTATPSATGAPEATAAGERSVESKSNGAKVAQGRKASSAGKSGQPRRQKPRRERRLVQPASSPRLSLPAWRMGGNADHLKIWGVTLCLLATLGVLGVSVYRFYSGPSVRVLQSID